MIRHEDPWDEDTLPWEAIGPLPTVARVRHVNRQERQERRRQKAKPAKPEPGGRDGRRVG
jgi:hypothetical protein